MIGTIEMDDYTEKMGDYTLIQMDSGHWIAVTPSGKESNQHWSKMWIRAWVKWHRKVGDEGAFV